MLFHVHITGLTHLIFPGRAIWCRGMACIIRLIPIISIISFITLQPH